MVKLIVRDIRERHRVRDIAALERLTDFMMDNVSNISSAKSIASSLAAGGSSVSDKTVGAYLDHLCKAFLLYGVRRYDIRIPIVHSWTSGQTTQPCVDNR